MNPDGHIYMDEADKIPAEDKARYERALIDADKEKLAEIRAAEARARIAFENPVSTPALNFHELREANVSRKTRWHEMTDQQLVYLGAAIEVTLDERGWCYRDGKWQEDEVDA